MLKLFRDYVFHQVMEDGRPFLDLAHVIACLNRLDAGIPDKVKWEIIFKKLSERIFTGLFDVSRRAECVGGELC